MSRAGDARPAHGATDARGVQLELPRPPQRIVSLVPSSTETLFALGLGERVVGRTRYCVHPAPEVQALPEVGGTKALAWERLAALQPDLIVANAEENKPEMWPRLEAIAPLWVAFPREVSDALHDLRDMARVCHVPAAGEALAVRIEEARSAARAASAGRSFRYAYLIWHAPWMAVNHDTFIARMLAEVGGVNVFAAHDERYPSVTLDELVAADPERVLLSSEPFDFTETHRAELGPLAERARFVDGELCSWHGARMEAAFAYLAALG
ncbi:MAG: ABC transporter substrate-binding protein [Planctomycetota bacterium]|nr:MAG: ABC transporter substrate-binding protein [Planctomycetota bacterium]